MVRTDRLWLFFGSPKQRPISTSSCYAAAHRSLTMSVSLTSDRQYLEARSSVFALLPISLRTIEPNSKIHQASRCSGSKLEYPRWQWPAELPYGYAAEYRHSATAMAAVSNGAFVTKVLCSSHLFALPVLFSSILVVLATFDSLHLSLSSCGVLQRASSNSLNYQGNL